MQSQSVSQAVSQSVKRQFDNHRYRGNTKSDMPTRRIEGCVTAGVRLGRIALCRMRSDQEGAGRWGVVEWGKEVHAT